MALYGIKLLLLQSYKFNQIKKTMTKSIKVVQFLHSGEEYKLSEVEKEAHRKDWNRDLIHRRKFLHAKGVYIKDGKKTEENDIYFWGEWEPESKVTSIFKKPIEGAKPHFINEPVVKIQSGHVVVPINKEDKNSYPVNTDPFVFGDKGFYYSCCMQSRYKKLQQLEPGSIILFGSNINHYRKSNSNINQEKEPKPYFALDTVFVVGEDKKTYSIDSYSEDLKSFPPEHYCEIMNFKGWKDSLNYPCNSNEKNDCKKSDCTSIKSKSEDCENGFDFTRYRGASYDNPITCENDSTKKMYSFVPCKIGSKGENGFERVKLSDKDFPFISNNLNQGVKYTEVTLEESFDIWNKLREIIHEDKEQGFEEAVRLDYTGEE